MDSFIATGIQSARVEERRGVERASRQFIRYLNRDGTRRLTWGVWVHEGRLPSSEVLVAHVLGQLAPRALVGVRSAAAMHGLLEAPEALDFVVPRTEWRTIAPWPFAFRRFDVTSTPVGDQVVFVPLEKDLALRVTSALRTVVDLLRLRTVVGLPTAALALRRFLDSGGDEIALASLCRTHRAEKGLKLVRRQAAALSSPPPVLDCRPLVFPAGLPERAPSVLPRR
ncbi:MAG: hypothetical protein AB1938_11775 [Myxococcota bacterium]